MKKTCLGSGIFNFDTIVKRTYPEGFVPGIRNKFSEEIISEEVGGTCGNVMCMLPYLGVQTYPIAHFDLTEQGMQMTRDLKRYGADVRFVRNTAKGGTTLLRCTHKLDENGQPAMSFRATGVNSRFAQRRHLRGRDEAPAFVEALDFVPDVFFFDTPESGYRVVASQLRGKGTLVYFEPERMDENTRNKVLNGISVSDVVKFSGEKISDTSFCDEYTDKLFIQTCGAKGLRFKLRGEGWVDLPPCKNDHVVDWEGAGDWTTSVFISELCKHDKLSINEMTSDDIRQFLNEAQRIAAKSVGYMSSKGMIHADPTWKPVDNTIEFKKEADNFEGVLDAASIKAQPRDERCPINGFFGGVCGDVIGSAYEHSRYRMKSPAFPLYTKRSHPTDDTVLTMAVAEWLMGERTNERLKELFVHWGKTYPHAGFSHNFKKWINSRTHATRTTGSNGAAMRVSPIGYAATTLDEALSLARQQAVLTHDSDEAIRGAQSVVAAIFLTRQGKTKEEVCDYLEQKFGYDLHRKVEDVRTDYQFELGCDKSVPEAILCWLQSDSYEEAIRNAISLGGDADTQADIAGAIAAVSYPIPDDIAGFCYNRLADDMKEILFQFNNMFNH